MSASSTIESPVNIALDYAVRYLTGTTWLSGEMQAFWMAIQGALAVRQGANKDRSLNWFHAFCLSVAAGFTGGWLGFVFMGLPSSMLSNDFNFGSCILAFVIINYTPLDLGYKLCTTVPVMLLTTTYAQLFRSVAIARFCNVCYEAFRDKPSPYYPIPIFGPILYATMLGNMAGFVLKGFNGYLQDGMPYPFQNGFFTATLYHFYAHDQTGPIGIALRTYSPLKAEHFGLDHGTFGTAMVSLFMQIVGVLQLPFLLGPSFSPFFWFGELLLGKYVHDTTKSVTVTTKSEPATVIAKATFEKGNDNDDKQDNGQRESAAAGKKKKKKIKKKKDE